MGFFPSHTRLGKVERKIELSQHRASVAASARADAERLNTLVTALELMLAKDAAMAERFGDRWPLDLAPVHAVNAARAAIAKARGAA